MAVAGVVRSITATLDVWHDQRPSDPSIASLRKDIHDGKTKPVEHGVRMTRAAIDDGKTAGEASRWAKDIIADAEQYAARRQQSTGVLPFRSKAERLELRETRVQGKCDCSAIGVEHKTPAQLREFRTDIQHHVQALQALEDCVSERIVELESVG